MSHRIKPGEFLGYRKNGQPIYLIGGASPDDPSNNPPTPQPPVVINNGPANPQGKYFTEEEVAKIRQQEKDKLYDKQSKLETNMTVMQEELQRLREEREKREAEEAARKKEIEDQRRAAEEAEMSSKQLVEKARQEFEAKQAELETKLKLQQTVFQKEREFRELQDYTREQVHLHENEIMDQLFDTITGNTKEEIDASVQRAIERTASIMESVTRLQTGQPRQQGVSTTGFTPTGPIDLNRGLPEQMTPEQQLQWLQSINDPAEWNEKVRGPLGLAGNQNNMNALWGQQ